MSPAVWDETQSLERFRSYLHVVARLRLQGEQQKRVDASAMVRQTLQDAERLPERLHGSTPAETATWLRRLLAQNLGNAFRVLHQQSANCTCAQSPGTASAAGDRLAEVDDPAIALAEALVQLPDDQREAVLLQYWHGLTLAEIGARLERTPAAVAGLLRRGLGSLRERLEGTG
jgi:RNA polymerase sigma-70 factor (ECF subfamily)